MYATNWSTSSVPKEAERRSVYCNILIGGHQKLNCRRIPSNKCLSQVLVIHFWFLIHDRTPEVSHSQAAIPLPWECGQNRLARFAPGHKADEWLRQKEVKHFRMKWKPFDWRGIPWTFSPFISCGSWQTRRWRVLILAFIRSWLFLGLIIGLARRAL